VRPTLEHGPVIEGYPDRLSYQVGEAVSIACRTTSPKFSVEISRVGAERETVWLRNEIPGRWQHAPEDAAARGCGWEESFRYVIPASVRSGYYEVALRAFDEHDGRVSEHLCFFVVRPRDQVPVERGILVVLATNTYNAYNDWGGPSLYTGGTKVSFRRPLASGFLRKPEPHVRYPNVGDIDDPEHEHFRAWADLHGLARWSGSAGWHNWERVFVRWAEREGYKVDVAVNADLEFHPEVLEGQHVVVSVGHDEYWSWGMRDALEAFIARGENAAFLSGNSVCWQVRYEDTGATMVCYKSSYKDDPVYGTPDRSRLTTLWSSELVDRPENRLTGVSFSRGGYVRMGRAVPRATGGYTTWRPEHWVFAGTGLRYGDVFGSPDAVVSYEVDGCELQISPDDGLPVPTGRDGTPRNFVVLATAPARLWSRDELPSRYRSGEPGDLEATTEAVFGDASPEHVARLAHNHAVMGIYTRGGTVFTTGTTEWSYGLRGHDPDVERITRNVLEMFSRPQRNA
jgi:hypothetical protein